jgi:F-type H+-transporting ATPase subunit b
VTTREQAWVLFSIFALVLLSPTLLLAAGGGGDHAMTFSDILWDLGIKTLNIGILGFFAFKYLSKPLNRAVELRAEKVQRELEGARAGRLEAEERLRRFQEKVAGLDTEIEELRKQTCGDIDKEQKILLEEARTAAAHIRQHARDTIRQEMAKARDDLHREAARLATQLAEERITRQISDGDRKRIVDGYIQEMEAAR